MSFSGEECSGLPTFSIPFPLSWFADDITEYPLHFCTGPSPEYVFFPVLCVATVMSYKTSADLL